MKLRGTVLWTPFLEWNLAGNQGAGLKTAEAPYRVTSDIHRPNFHHSRCIPLGTRGDLQLPPPSSTVFLIFWIVLCKNPWNLPFLAPFTDIYFAPQAASALFCHESDRPVHRKTLLYILKRNQRNTLPCFCRWIVVLHDICCCCMSVASS